MKSRACVALAMMLCALHGEVAMASETCAEPDSLFAEASFFLSRVTRREEEFVGEFVIENRGIHPSLVIGGRRVGESFEVDYPTAVLEFQDLNKSWSMLVNNLLGTYLPDPDQIEIRVGEKSSINIHLFATDWNELSGSDFRVAMRLKSPAKCILSAPFRAYPERAPISHFQTLTRPGEHRNTSKLPSREAR
jgi:hypothetical protein